MNTATNSPRYPAEALRTTLATLFEGVGMEADKATTVAASLVAADAMGHDTHGLALVPWYMDSIGSGGMTLSGQPEVLSDRRACVAWNGRKLPGAWLIERGIDLALERIADCGVFTLTIASSQHTGALATYLPRLTKKGLMPILCSSSPAATGVAPYGGTRPVFTPNPISAGIPTQGDPILLDISASITTNNRARQLAQRGERFPSAWALDAQGQLTDDPKAALAGGSLLPVGGLDHGHKGYGMALLVEALTQGLSGVGRRHQPKGVQMNVFLQVIDPEAFGGRAGFEEETGWLAEACRSNPPRPGVSRVRVPGEQASRLQREAEAGGVPLSPAIVQEVSAALAARGLALPAPVQ